MGEGAADLVLAVFGGDDDDSDDGEDGPAEATRGRSVDASGGWVGADSSAPPGGARAVPRVMTRGTRTAPFETTTDHPRGVGEGSPPPDTFTFVVPGREGGPNGGGGGGRWETPHAVRAVRGLALARGALSPEAQAWVMRAIRAEDVIDFPPPTDEAEDPEEAAKNQDEIREKEIREEEVEEDEDAACGGAPADEDVPPSPPPSDRGGKRRRARGNERTMIAHDRTEHHPSRGRSLGRKLPSEGTRKAPPVGRRNQVMRFGGDLPSWARVLATAIDAMARAAPLEAPLLPPGVLARGARLFDQMIVNAYAPGEGLAPHVDLAAFADGVVVVSLESSIVMDLYPPSEGTDPSGPLEPATTMNDGGEEGSAGGEAGRSRERENRAGGCIPLWLHPGDVLFLSGDARWRWRHGIAGRSWDWATREDIESSTNGVLRGAAIVREDGDEETSDEAPPAGRVRVARRHRTSVTLRAMRDEVHELKVPA